VDKERRQNTLSDLASKTNIRNLKEKKKEARKSSGEFSPGRPKGRFPQVRQQGSDRPGEVTGMVIGREMGRPSKGRNEKESVGAITALGQGGGGKI